MARARRPSEPSSYEAEPEIPTEIAARFGVVSSVISEQLTISEAAERLGMARVNAQSLVHRVKAAMIASMLPRPTGPRPKPARERELEQKVKALEKQVAKLQKQLQAADDMMGAAGEIIRALRGLPPRPTSRTSSRRASTTSSPPSSASPSGEDPEPPATTISRALAHCASAREQVARAARCLGIRVETLRRWLGRLARGEPLIKPRGGKRRAVSHAQEQSVRTYVRALAGMVGASSLAHSVAGISRRSAAAIKRDELALMERERKLACARVTVMRAGIMRNFDQLYVSTGVALIASDAHVPYRTSAVRVDRYDAEHVAAVLVRDFETHGPPLVLRLDNASCHTAPAVVSVLDDYRVIALHGPPRHPQYYGQHERQNREHRIWTDHYAASDHESLGVMTWALNALWRRPTLAWRTAEDVWRAREPVDEDRQALRDEVHERAARLGTEIAPDLAMRRAIEQALITRGYLRIETGRHSLCELPV